MCPRFTLLRCPFYPQNRASAVTLSQGYLSLGDIWRRLGDGRCSRRLNPPLYFSFYGSMIRSRLFAEQNKQKII